MRSIRNIKTLNCVLRPFEMRAAVSFTPGLSQVSTRRSEGPSRFDGLQFLTFEMNRWLD
jgi:hypothetical protein